MHSPRTAPDAMMDTAAPAGRSNDGASKSGDAVFPPYRDRVDRAISHCAGYDQNSALVRRLFASANRPVDASKQLPRRNADYDGNIKSNIVQSHALNRSALEQLCHGEFASALLPGGRQYSAKAANFAAVGWLNHVSQLSDSEAALKCVLTSTGLGLLALITGDIHIRFRSLQAHNRAIYEVAKTSKRQDWYKRDSMLAATRLLLCYEYILPVVDGAQLPQSHGCHVDGTQALLLARGPHAFTSGIAHQLYTDSRHSLILSAILKRRRSPLCTYAWRTIPWTSQKKSIKDELFDVVQELPALVEQVVAFLALQPVSSTKHLEMRILAQCNTLHGQFASWMRKASPYILKFDYTIIPNMPLPIPQDETEISLLHLSMMFWIALMILYSILQFFNERSGEDDIDFDTKENSQSVTEHSNKEDQNLTLYANMYKGPNLYASKCVHALHLFGEFKGGVAESLSVIVPLWFTMRYFLNRKSGQHKGNELEVLRKALSTKLFGSSAASHITKISGRTDEIDRIMGGENATHDAVLWF
ncbi:hypothetical protein QQS21_000343 [Conoideocrella luteorostrata]|uniref:Uncharacterized protein n=1 Tax=Conoideocrella luteorostrata TaxID=1105319 RepID=A0AAJ0G2U8_9HYPO|nr:hypothetical protein QQS21_000343 [Conoideocrella luteorostrata]